jgi:hypothetical protein
MVDLISFEYNEISENHETPAQLDFSGINRLG